MKILEELDAAIAGTCPCGAEPAEGSAYCCDDCRPTHISDDTDQRMSGELATAMRWRPDLLTAADDDNLEPLPIDWADYAGRFNPHLFQRTDRDAWHLRLDDGHRYVGLDVDLGDIDPTGANARERVRATWERLEQELSRVDRTEPGPRWTPQDVAAALRRMFPHLNRLPEFPVDGTIRVQSATDTAPRSIDGGVEPCAPGRLFIAPLGTPAGGEGWREVGPASEFVVDESAQVDWSAATARFTAAFEAMRPVFVRLSEQVRATADRLRAAGVLDQPFPEDLMLAEIERRRSGVGAGPGDQRGLDGRRRRTR